MDKNKNKNKSNQNQNQNPNQNQKANKAEAKRKKEMVTVKEVVTTKEVTKEVVTTKKVVTTKEVVTYCKGVEDVKAKMAPKVVRDKKPKEPKEAPVTTAVLKLSLRCQCLGCIEKIRELVSRTKGVQEKALDKEKELVTVKGTMDAKALAESLNKMLKRPVEVVPPKKKKEGGGDGDKKDKDGGCGGKKKGGA